MPAAPAPPPAAPAAKPATTAAPEAPAPPPDGGSISFDADIDAELSEMDDEKPPAKPAAKTEKPPAKPPVKPAAKTEKPAAKPAAKKEEEESPEGEPGEAPEEKPEHPPVKAADLRGAYEGLKKKVREQYEPEIAQLKSKIQKLETEHPQSSAALVEELASIKKERDELAERIRFVDYQAHPEFKEKYEKPYQEAWARAAKDLSEIEILDPFTEERRTATPQDLIKLCNLPLGEARKMAKEVFGDAADDMMNHRRQIRELSDAQQKALEDAKGNTGEHQKKLAAQRQIEHQETLKLWNAANKELAEKYPKWFAPDETDNEGNALLNRGFALADLHFIGAKDLTQEQIEMLPPMFRDPIKTTGKLPTQARVALDALLRNKIASHGRLARKLKTASARIKELEDSLAQYESSEPPAGRAARGDKPGASTNPFEEATAELDSLDQ